MLSHGEKKSLAPGMSWFVLSGNKKMNQTVRW